MWYGYDNFSGRSRLSGQASQCNKQYVRPEIKKTSFIIPSKESSHLFISGTVNMRPPKIKQSNAPFYILCAFLAYVGVARWNSYKTREMTFMAEKKKKQEQDEKEQNKKGS